MITYAYARVSDTAQNLERQYTAIKRFRPEIPEENIFSEKQSGKDFDRANYQAMKIVLEHVVKAKGETEIIEVVFEELDRLGRNTEGIKQELQWFKDMGICVRILEIPTTLMDIQTENKWVMEMVTQILIEVYAHLAQVELEKRAKRQREGIDEALKKGIKFGRKPIEVDRDDFISVYNAWKAGEITAVKAMKQLDLKPNTFYRRVQEYEGRLPIQTSISETGAKPEE